MTMTTTRGSTARTKEGSLSPRLPWRISAGSKSPAAVACSRIFSSTTGAAPGLAAVALAGLARGRFGTAEPPHAESHGDDRRDDAQAGGREGRGAEVRHRNGVIDRGRSRERRHGERERTEADGRRHQAARDVRGPEHLLRHGHQHEKGDKDADAAIGDYGRGEHDREHRAACSQPFGQETRDRGDRTAVVHELAEQPAEQEQGKPLRDEASRTAHERLRPVGEERLARDRGGQERRQPGPPAVRSTLDRRATSAGRARAISREVPWLSTPNSELGRVRRRQHRPTRLWLARNTGVEGERSMSRARKARSEPEWRTASTQRSAPPAQ